MTGRLLSKLSARSTILDLIATGDTHRVNAADRST